MQELPNLDTIHFPKFNTEQIEFFNKMILLLQQDRLVLDPRSTDSTHFNLQWNSLESMELTYKWLIESNYAVIEAETEERIGGNTYSPQEKLDSAGESDTEVLDNNLTF
jgi:hypothetical protein